MTSPLGHTVSSQLEQLHQSLQLFLARGRQRKSDLGDVGAGRGRRAGRQEERRVLTDGPVEQLRYELRGRVQDLLVCLAPQWRCRGDAVLQRRGHGRQPRPKNLQPLHELRDVRGGSTCRSRCAEWGAVRARRAPRGRYVCRHDAGTSSWTRTGRKHKKIVLEHHNIETRGDLRSNGRAGAGRDRTLLRGSRGLVSGASRTPGVLLRAQIPPSVVQVGRIRQDDDDLPRQLLGHHLCPALDDLQVQAVSALTFWPPMHMGANVLPLAASHGGAMLSDAAVRVCYCCCCCCCCCRCCCVCVPRRAHLQTRVRGHQASCAGRVLVRNDSAAAADPHRHVRAVRQKF